MNVAELLAAKTIVAARLADVGISVTTNGGPTYMRVRISLNTDTYVFLSEKQRPNATLRSTTSGHAARGLVISLTENGGQALVNQSKNTVTTNAPCKDLYITENRVARQQLQAVLAEYEDGTRYLLIPPLPVEFLSTSVREQLKRRNPGPSKAVQIAFDLAGVHLAAEQFAEEPAAGPITPEPAALPTDLVVAPEEIKGKSEVRVLSRRSSGPIATDDLRAVLAMLNEQVISLREQGITVDLRIGDEELVRARVQVVFQEDL